MRRGQQQRPQPRKTVLGLSSGEDGFHSLETKHDKRMASRPKLLLSARRLQKEGQKTQKLSWV
jgi:hypothetical protein